MHAAIATRGPLEKLPMIADDREIRGLGSGPSGHPRSKRSAQDLAPCLSSPLLEDVARRFGVLGVIFFVACSAGTDERDFHGEETVGAITQAIGDGDPVSAAVDQSCTTTIVKGLSTQLVDAIQCLRPGTFERIDGVAGLDLGSAVFPYLQSPAQRALLAAQKERGVTMTINSALRTLPQQYLLYRWYQTKRCGIGLAASPGKSNHESGLALDIADNAGWQPVMKKHGFTWLGASDPVHFDFTGAERADIGGLSVLAFQKLWNTNHPEDKIEEDSDYGPATAERLAKAPVGGFPKGIDCTGGATPPPPAESSGGPPPPSGEPRPLALDEDDGCNTTSRDAGARSGAALLLAVVFAIRRRREKALRG